MSADQENSSPAQPGSVSSAELQQAVLPLQPQTGQQPPPQAPGQEIQSGASGNVAGSETTNAVEPSPATNVYACSAKNDT